MTHNIIRYQRIWVVRGKSKANVQTSKYIYYRFNI